MRKLKGIVEPLILKSRTTTTIDARKSGTTAIIATNMCTIIIIITKQKLF